ncbi:hypothetical protein C789_4129 [Microcystis aeruginosa FACHB-905 = DIANCHI905]|nr:hypothetical protein C789_4129 [Microcystis aeruginosa FACHB-905 = DIANCHI905]
MHNNSRRAKNFYHFIKSFSISFFDEFYESFFIGISHSSHPIYSTTSSLSANFFLLFFPMFFFS